MTWQFTLTGLLIGVLVGLTGMGGGALLTPILRHPVRFQADVRRRHGHDALRLALAGVLALSGVKLLNVPEANWVIAAGFVLGAAFFVPWVVRTYLARPRPAPVRTFD